MDSLYIILFIIIIALLISNNSSLSKKIGELEFRILSLHEAIRKLNLPKPTEEQKATSPKEEIPVPKPVIEKAPNIPKPAPHIETEVVEYHKEVISDHKAGTVKSKVEASYFFHQQPKEPQLSFFERYPDLEKFIGENLVNKIGIAILVLAIGFFVKYAIDNDWVGPAGRVGIGVLCGGILIGIAHRLRKNYKAFSSVLVGGGLAIFYFTITLAYHEFHLFSQTTSFIIMIVITCFAVALSMLYDKQELAVIALVGGMSSPFMVSNGSANYNALFIYLLVLNAGLLIIAYNKSWRILNISAFGLTVLVLGGIIYTLPKEAYGISFIYITALYLMFFAINIANNIKENKKFIASDFTILLVNTALYFSVGLYLLTMMNADIYRGVFSASLGALNLLLSFILFKTKKAEINILYLLIGITLTFISLTAPIQLQLYWLYQKSGIKLMRLASLIIWVAMLFSLLIDWYDIYGSSAVELTIMGNKGFITTICVAISCFLTYILALRPNENKPLIRPDVFKYLAVALLFAAGALEINHQFLNHYPSTDLNVLYLMLYLPVFVYVFGVLAPKILSEDLNWTLMGWIYAVTIGIYLMVTPIYFDMQAIILTSSTIDASHFWAHWVGDIFVLLIFYRLITDCKSSLQQYIKPVSWAIAAGIVLFLSLEICLVSNVVFYSRAVSIDHLETLYIKTGLPVLWGISSFALMWLGMRYKTRVLRIISLTLFTLTLVKLFVFDIENIPPAGKIAAFFCLGVLLLIISFMYQKVKVIIADDGDVSKK
jgi:uncharacterized membrane protein